MPWLGVFFREGRDIFLSIWSLILGSTMASHLCRRHLRRATLATTNKETHLGHHKKSVIRSAVSRHNTLNDGISSAVSERPLEGGTQFNKETLLECQESSIIRFASGSAIPHHSQPWHLGIVRDLLGRAHNWMKRRFWGIMCRVWFFSKCHTILKMVSHHSKRPPGEGM